MLAEGLATQSKIVRTAISMALLVAAASVAFLPIADGLLGTALYALLLLASIMVQPSRASAWGKEKAPRISWRDRDIGERFSIMMFHALIWSGSVFFAWYFSSQTGGLLGPAVGMGIVAVATWVVLWNWKNRNAR